MKVLHLTSGNMFGGVESVLLTLARYREVCPAMEPHFALCFEGRVLEELRSLNVATSLLPPVRRRFPWTVWSARRRLSELLSQVRFDVAIAHMSWPHAMFGPAVTEAGVPLIHYAHGPYPDPPEWVDRRVREIPASFIIANSTYTFRKAQEILPGVKGKIVFYPVSLLQEKRGDRLRENARREYQVPDDETVIIQVGRMERWKGHRIHIEALTALKDIPGWSLWLVGGAQTPEQQEYENELRQRASELGLEERIRFWGQRSDVPALMAAADIFCQPNIGAEPFGLVYVEAMWAGLAVVGSRLGGVPEIISEDCGFLVPAEDPDALSSVLKLLVNDKDLRRRLGANGPARAAHLCDPAARINDLHQVLQSVTDPPQDKTG